MTGEAFRAHLDPCPILRYNDRKEIDTRSRPMMHFFAAALLTAALLPQEMFSAPNRREEYGIVMTDGAKQRCMRGKILPPLLRRI